MGTCFSKKSTPTLQQMELKSNPLQPDKTKKNEPQVIKKEIFLIKHRVSHEENPCNPSGIDVSMSTVVNGESGTAGGVKVRTSSRTNEEVDAILMQCGRLSRSNSTGAGNPNRKRRYSGSKRSFDFDLDMYSKNDDDDDEALNHHHRHRQREPRVSSPSSRRSSRERDPRQQRSGSRERGSGSGGGRRVSISPSRRSESPFSNSNGGAASGGSSNRPGKMVSVPATHKSNNAGGGQAMAVAVKRIHVRRNVGDAVATVVSRTAASPCSGSPDRANHRFLSEHQSQEERRKQQSETMEAERLAFRRNPLAQIDNNAAISEQLSNKGCFLHKPSDEQITNNKSKEQQKVDETKLAATVPRGVEDLKLRQKITRTRSSRLSRDLDINPETLLHPIQPSYASLLLEDIHNFHQKNTTSVAAAAPPAFSLPACLSKACSIMEAVADLNSTTSSLFSGRVNKDSLVESETKIHDDLMDGTPHGYITVRRGVSAATEEQESSGSNVFACSQHLNWLPPSWEPNAANPTNRTSLRSNTRECEVNPLGNFKRELLDYRRNGTRRDRTNASSISLPNSTTVAST